MKENVLLYIYGALSLILFPFLFYYGMCFISKILKTVTRALFCLLFNLPYDLITKISNKNCNLKDFFELIKSSECSDSKKALLNYIIQNYPKYIIPNFHNLEFYKKEIPHLYEKAKLENNEYPSKISSIYADLSIFEDKLIEYIKQKNRDFYYKYVIKQNN